MLKLKLVDIRDETERVRVFRFINATGGSLARIRRRCPSGIRP